VSSPLLDLDAGPWKKLPSAPRDHEVLVHEAGVQSVVIPLEGAPLHRQPRCTNGHDSGGACYMATPLLLK
jgi:hypothetical protein